MGDSHVKWIRRNDLNKELKNCKAIFRSFSGANTKELDHYILPLPVDDKTDAVIIHVGTTPSIETHLAVVRELPTKKFLPECVNEKSSNERRS